VAQALLGWMQRSGPRLRELLADEARRGGDLSPAGEAAVRAHLRLVAEALAATAGPGARAALDGFAAALPDRCADAGGEVADEIALLGEAAAQELRLQFGSEPTADDPAVREMVERRLRVQAWTRWFVRRLGEVLGDDRLADAALSWMAARQTHLAYTIFTMDRRAKEAEIARAGEAAVDDPALVNRIGQAAMLQAHTRFLVEAVAASLARTL
jgi:hypothetical protein